MKRLCCLVVIWLAAATGCRAPLLDASAGGADAAADGAAGDGAAPDGSAGDDAAADVADGPDGDPEDAVASDTGVGDDTAADGDGGAADGTDATAETSDGADLDAPVDADTAPDSVAPDGVDVGDDGGADSITPDTVAPDTVAPDTVAPDTVVTDTVVTDTVVTDTVVTDTVAVDSDGGGDDPCKGKDCNDNNPCTEDLCAAGVCNHPAQGGPCDDGEICTVNDACAGGSCQGGGANPCDDKQDCTKDSCDLGKGCAHAPLTGAFCSDGNPCSNDDVCQGGVCKGGPAPNCDDLDPCTKDTCALGKGCISTPAANPCSDGDACTTGDMCKDGKCLPGAVTPCDDDNACTADSCDPKQGCKHGAKDGACDDGDACSKDDACKDGACAPGAPLNCDDGNTCTSDSCAKGGANGQSGCQHKPAADGAACALPGACAPVCAAGACKGAPAPMWDKTIGGPGAHTVRAIAAGPDGSALVVGSAPSAAGPHLDTWAAAYDAVGSQLWQASADAFGKDDELVDAVAVPNGEWLAVGNSAEASAASTRMRAVRLNKTGTMVAVTVGSKPGIEVARALAAVPYGASTYGALAFDSKSANGVFANASVQMLSSAGNASSSPLRLPPSADAGMVVQTDDIASLADGTLIVVGSVGTTKGVRHGALWRARFAGAMPKLQAMMSLGDSGNDRLVAVAPFGSDVVVLGATSVTGKGVEGWLERIGGDGSRRWSRSFGDAAADDVCTGLAVGQGRIATLCNHGLGARELKVWDGDGLEIAKVTHKAASGKDIAGGSLAASDIGWWAAGTTVPATDVAANPTDGWIVRSDVWGHGSCAAAGKCLGKDAKGCDDGDGCTSDGCSGGYGCLHGPAGAGVLCKDAEACTAVECSQAGKCAMTRQKLGMKQDYSQSPWGMLGNAGMPIPAPGGGWRTAVELITGEVQIIAMDRWGQATSGAKFATGWSGPLKVIPVEDGIFVHRGDSSQGLVRKFGWSGKEIAEYLTPDKSGAPFPRAVIAAPGHAAWITWAGSTCAAGALHRVAYHDGVSATFGWATSPGACLTKVSASHSDGTRVAMAASSDANPSYTKWSSWTTPADGKPVVQLAYQGLFSHNSSVSAITGAPDSTDWLAAGIAFQYGTSHYVAALWRITNGGVQVWQRDFGTASPSGGWLSAVSVTSDGNIVIAGHVRGTDQTLARVMAKLLPTGDIVWWRHHQAVQIQATADRIDALTDGFAWRGADGRVTRTDLWGYPSCNDAGTCFTTTPASCDDKNPCTLDNCVKDKGCSHPPVADYLACGGGNYCKAGVCLSPKPTCGPQTVAISHKVNNMDWITCAPDYPVWGIGPTKPDQWKANGDGSYSDGLTGLTWKAVTGKTTHSDAHSQCDNYSLGGASDWRLPTRAELRTIVDYTVGASTQPIAAVIKPAINYDVYWSATLWVGDTTYASTLNAATGVDTPQLRAAQGGAVLCVR